MSPPRGKRQAIVAVLGLASALFSLFVLSRTSTRDHQSVQFFSNRSSPLSTLSQAGQDAATAVQRSLLRGKEWKGLARFESGSESGGDDGMSGVLRRLAAHAPPGEPYFTDDESGELILEEHHHGPGHKKLHPINGWDLAGVGLACIGLMIAAAGGIGGGGILVPLYILVLGFDPKHAIPLSNITIFGGAITNTLLNLSKRHPDADRPLVDWDLILVMEPLTIGGALVGSFINKVRLLCGRLRQKLGDRTCRTGMRNIRMMLHAA